MKYYIVKTFLFAICFIIIFIPEYCSADTEPLNLNPLNLGNTANYSNDVNTGTSLNFKSVPEISILRLFLKVVAVLIIILVFFYIVRKVVSKKKMIYGGSNLFQTITAFQIGTNKSLHLVEFSNQIYLLGVTDSNINLIDKITDPEQIDSIKLYSDMISTSGSKQNFMEFVLNAFSKKNNKEYELKDFKHLSDYEK